MPGLVANFLSAMAQEHERGVGGWHAEWPTIAAAVQATGAAAAEIAEIAEGLTVDGDRMRQNIAATRGTIYAEKAMLLLAEKVGRDEAHQLLEEATRRAVTGQRSLSDVLGEMADVTKHLSAETIRRLDVAEDYLGSAEAFQRRQLQGNFSRQKHSRKKSRKKKD